MPLRCVDPRENVPIHAFDLSAEDWARLVNLNRQHRHLRLPCCSAEVTLRRSRKGTQFFAHKSIGSCATAPETEAHLRLKQIAVEVARANGWEAATEVAGQCPNGERWTADVLATRGDVRVAIEIQWSSQTAAETASRQARYASAGVRGLWLMRRLAAPLSEHVPAVLIIEDDARQFSAHLPSPRGEQAMPIADFLHAAFQRRLKFGLPLGARATLAVQAGTAPCWSCGAFTRVLTDFRVEVGPHEFTFSVEDTEDVLPLFDSLYRRLVSDCADMGAIKRRYSKTMGGSYLSNGCAHCDAHFGRHFEHEACEDRETVLKTRFPINDRWRGFLEDQDDYHLGWGVFEFA
jgi:competence protein CoiA